MLPNSEQAWEFALMLQAGVPPGDAIQYFISDIHPEAAKDLAGKWVRQTAVQEALLKLQGGQWAKLRPEERIRLALDKTYNEMAYFLYRNNYAELTHPALQVKADKCRMALEAKLAGMAGQMTAISHFWEDLMAGRYKLPENRNVEQNSKGIGEVGHLGSDASRRSN